MVANEEKWHYPNGGERRKVTLSKWWRTKKSDIIQMVANEEKWHYPNKQGDRALSRQHYPAYTVCYIGIFLLWPLPSDIPIFINGYKSFKHHCRGLWKATAGP